MEEDALLQIEKEEFKEKVYSRLRIGLDFLEEEVIDEKSNQALWSRFIDWDTYNLEMIRQAFNISNNRFAEDYKREMSLPGIIISGGNDSRKKRELSLFEKVESTKEEMEHQIRKLKWFYEKIELLREGESIKKEKDVNSIKKLLNLLNKFHKVAQELRNIRKGKQTIIISDEYDVQLLIGGLLRIHFDDIRDEDSSPKNSGGSSRIDFVLKNEKIIIEIKMANERLGEKELGNQLLIDIGRYKEYPDCKYFVIFIYDKGDFVRNKIGLIRDLQKQSTDKMNIIVVINPD